MDMRNLKNKGVLIDAAINQFHWKQAIPVLPKDLQIIFDAYKADYENDNVYSIQQSMKFTVAGSLYVGKADQVRRGAKGLAVWDIKYSNLNGITLIERYLPSLMIYAWGLKVRIGGIINVKNYGNLLPVFHCIDAPKPKLKHMKQLDRVIHEVNDSLR